MSHAHLQMIFVLNFLAGFCLVCIILPIDLLVMSFMRYIRFQFEVINDDLVKFFFDLILFSFQTSYVSTFQCIFLLLR